MCRYEHRFDIHIFQTNGDKNIYSGSVYKQTYTCICPYIYTLYIY